MQLSGEIEKKSCEITLKPESNEKLSTLELANSGENNEHLAVNIELEGATLGASGGGCETAGLKSTSAAKLTGVIEAFEVTPGVAAPVFRLSFGGGMYPRMTGLNQTRTVSITNFGDDPGKPGAALVNAGPHFASYDVQNKTVAECGNTELISQGSCTMTVKFIATAPGGVVAYQKIQILAVGGAVLDQMAIFANV